MSMAEAPPLLESGAWQHQQQQSWIRLDRHGSEFIIGLELRNDLSREVIQRYLQQLQLSMAPDASAGERRNENMSARIERVRQATQRLTRIQAFIRHSFEHMPDGIIVTDELGVIRFANQHIQDWFGEPMPSLNGLPLVRLLDGHDPREHPPWHETVSETLTLRSSQTVDLTVKGKDFLIHFAPFALPGTTQSGIIANIADISELREQQRQHREAIDFISHDVRSPLVSQLALIEQMKRAPEHIDAQQLEQLGRLARRSYHLAEEFVQLARAELGFEAAPHQGMGLAAYTTFTSPLRKFTDFYVHRLIKAALWQAPMSALSDQQLAALQATQMRARQAANALETWLKSDFAKTLPTEPQDGTITRTVPAGFFVRLDSNGLEGFVSCKDLDGKYGFDPITLRLTHHKTGRIFQLDQRVRVSFDNVDDERRQINFKLVSADEIPITSAESAANDKGGADQQA
ncbi:MAG: hypothetical protein B7X58_08660 [Marinobacter sp. 34-60-7]|nr:MAG: hypothetical protein B7X58_08660 [Marinobacter sp. 34-60-7]